MKIVEAQNATLTNLEVYEFLNNQAKEYQAQKRRGPGNLETLRREVRSMQIMESFSAIKFPQPCMRRRLLTDSANIT